MTTYQKCSDTERKLLHQVIKECYPDIDKAGVTFDLLFAYAERDKNNQPKGPALKLHGVGCAALIKKTSVVNRICGLSDVLIRIDGDAWPKLHEAEQAALMDHELCHIVLEKADAKKFVLDNAGRPLIEIQNHDFDIGGFHEVIERRGRAAFEAQYLSLAVEQHGQLTFTFDKTDKEAA